MACRSKSARVVSCKHIDNDSFTTIPDTSFIQTSVLVRAIYFENVQEVKFLLERGSNPNKPVGKQQLRPLMMACFVKNNARRLDIFRTLFGFNVDPELTDNKQQNCLMYACALKLKTELQVILDNFVCSFSNKDYSGNTLLHICAKYSTVDVIDIVLQKMHSYSMNINIRNNDNYTPLDLAILRKNIECAEKILTLGGQSTLFGHTNGSDFIELIKRQGRKLSPQMHPKTVDNFLATSSLPFQTQLQQCLVDSPPLQKIKSPVMLDSPTLSNSGEPLKDPEEILHVLLDIHSKRIGCAHRYPSQRQVPLDEEWVAAVRSHLHAIATTERCILESIPGKPVQSGRSSKESLPHLFLSIPKEYPMCLYKKVLILNMASRSMSPSRRISKSTEGSSNESKNNDEQSV